MGFLERLGLRRSATRDPGASPPTVNVQSTPASTLPPQPGYPALAFGVIDVETTGLSPSGDRIIELAIVRCDSHGRTVDHWVCRFNPEGPVGATHIHGITADEVAHAPRFQQVVPEISTRLAGLALVAHNARFDLAFLRAEYARAGWALPWIPALCTLQESWHYLPHLNRRRLPDCCAAAGIRLEHAHSALGDALATAGLLANYLNPTVGTRPRGDHLDLPNRARTIAWPTEPGGVAWVDETPRHAPRYTPTPTAPAPRLVTLLKDFPLAEALDEGAPQGSGAYLETLAEVLEDGVMTDDEVAALADLATFYELAPRDVEAANRGLLLALAHRALDDGRVSRAERQELQSVADILALERSLVTKVLDTAEAARQLRMSGGLRPLPADWSHGDPLRVGDRVVFTGCDEAQREQLERRATELGVRVLGNVSGLTAMLVADGSFCGTKAAAAATVGTRVVHPDEFAILLDHLQPAQAKQPRGQNGPGSTPATSGLTAPAGEMTSRTGSRTEDPPAPRRTQALPGEKPAAIRRWARENGYEVGERGRLPVEILEAYRTRAGA